MFQFLTLIEPAKENTRKMHVFFHYKFNYNPGKNMWIIKLLQLEYVKCAHML